MRYQRVEWHQSSCDYPVVLYAEMDDDGWEVRKVDEFADGRLAWADADHENAETGTELGLVTVPPLAEINSDAEFDGTEIGAAEFESIWARARASRDIQRL